MIESKDNKKIKHIKSLNQKKYRIKNKEYYIEGIKSIKESLFEKADIKYILINEKVKDNIDIKKIVEMCDECNLDYTYVEKNIFAKITNTVNSQGIICVIKVKDHNKEDLLLNKTLIIYCDRIQDPGNLGTIIRTADAFGPAVVFLSKGCVDTFNPKVVRAAASALLRIPVLNDSCDEILPLLKEMKYLIISTVTDSEKTFKDITNTERICLVIGNEGQGISEQIKQLSDLNVTIKMTGNSESLNASVAAGISIYELRKIMS